MGLCCRAMDGYIKGVWAYKIRGSQIIVKINMFASATSKIRKGIEAEAERLADFLQTQVVLEYEGR